MSKLTYESVNAFMNAEKFKRNNTEVEVLPNVTLLKLHGNTIAYKYNDPEKTISITNCGWFTKTTKERLNAIDGVAIHQRKFKWFLNDQFWNGKLINIKNN